MKYIFTLLTAVLIAPSFAQDISKKEAKGTKNYITNDLPDAIYYYEGVEPSKLSTEGLRNLSNAYRYLFQLEKAESSFAQLVNRSDSKPEDNYFYAEVLLMNGKRDEWKMQMNKFASKMATDSRAIEFAQRKGDFEVFDKKTEELDTLVNMDINTDKEEFGVSYYNDNIVFASSKSNNGVLERKWSWTGFPFLNLYEAHPTAEHQVDGLTRFNKEVNDKYHEGPASFSKDGKLMVFTTNYYEVEPKNEKVRIKMVYAVKNDEGKWGEFQEFKFNSPTYSVGQPALTEDGNTLYFTSDMPGGYGKTDLYKVTRTGDTWSDPINLGDKINTEGREMFPFIHRDGLLFFASDGHIGLGGLDIYVAQATDNRVSEPRNVGAPMNDKYDDFALVLDSVQNMGYVSSNRPGGKGSDDIYSVKLKAPFMVAKEVKLITKNNYGDLIEGVAVTVANGRGEEILNETLAESSGIFLVDNSTPEDYKVTGVKNDYVVTTQSYSLDNTDETPNEVELILQKKEFRLVGNVTDKNSNAPLNNVKVVLVNNDNNTGETYSTDATGGFAAVLEKAKLNQTADYTVKLSKEGYLDNEFKYKVKLDEYGDYIIPTELLAMINLNDIDIVEINAIYFDLDKSNIRPDAAKELDKIVGLLNKYPDLEIELGAHTDCRAPMYYNDALSARRAASSANYIKQRITKPERVYGKGYGENKLLNDCACEPSNESSCSKDAHQKNRRTEFKIIKKGDYDVMIKNNSPISF